MSFRIQGFNNEDWVSLIEGLITRRVPLPAPKLKLLLHAFDVLLQHIHGLAQRVGALHQRLDVLANLAHVGRRVGGTRVWLRCAARSEGLRGVREVSGRGRA